jgi:hypothetical protein
MKHRATVLGLVIAVLGIIYIARADEPAAKTEADVKAASSPEQPKPPFLDTNLVTALPPGINLGEFVRQFHWMLPNNADVTIRTNTMISVVQQTNLVLEIGYKGHTNIIILESGPQVATNKFN